jgi:hypothetical protein
MCTVVQSTEECNGLGASRQGEMSFMWQQLQKYHVVEHGKLAVAPAAFSQ